MARRHATKPALLVALAVALAVGGCAAGLERAVPPVDARLSAAGQAAGHDAVQLARGRDVYLDQCAGCHQPIAIDRFSAERWAGILPDMVERTKLEPGPAADVAAYVKAVLESSPGH